VSIKSLSFEDSSLHISDSEKSESQNLISHNSGSCIDSVLYPFSSVESSNLPSENAIKYKLKLQEENIDKKKYEKNVYLIPSFSLLGSRNFEINFIFYLSPSKIALLVDKRSVETNIASSDIDFSGEIDDKIGYLKFKVLLFIFIIKILFIVVTFKCFILWK
jgi:hypothetical protein